MPPIVWGCPQLYSAKLIKVAFNKSAAELKSNMTNIYMSNTVLTISHLKYITQVSYQNYMEFSH